MADQAYEPVLIMLPDRSIRMFDCLAESSLTVDDVLRDYPGHTLGQFPDSRRPALDCGSPLKPGATYYLLAQKPRIVQPLAVLDADITLSSVPSTPSSTCSSRPDCSWSSSSSACSSSGQVTPRTPSRRPQLFKSSSFKSEEEDCSWTSQTSPLDDKFRFSMPFPPKPSKSSRPTCGLPRIPKPPVSPSPRAANSILKELQELEDAEKTCSRTTRNPILAELKEMEDQCEYVFTRSSTAGRSSCSNFNRAITVGGWDHTEKASPKSIRSDMEAVKAELKKLAATSESIQEKERAEASRKQSRKGVSVVLNKLSNLKAFGRRKVSSAPLETLEENKERNNLPSCMDLGILCGHEEEDVDWNAPGQMFYSMRL